MTTNEIKERATAILAQVNEEERLLQEILHRSVTNEEACFRLDEVEVNIANARHKLNLLKLDRHATRPRE